ETGRVEVDDLADGMNASVGAAAGIDAAALAGQGGEGLLQRLLDGTAAGLGLPAVEVGTVVAQNQFDVPHEGHLAAVLARRGPRAVPARRLNHLFGSQPRCTSTSAIWMALVAAPLRRLSATTQ